MMVNVARFLVVLSMTIACTANAATVIVPDDDPSLRDAVEGAAPGDVIQVRPGTYLESIRVDHGQTGLTIEGLGGIPVLQPPPNDDGVRIFGVSNVTLRSLTVSGGANAVRIDKAAGTSLDHLGIAAPRKDGVRAKDAPNTTLTNVLAVACRGRAVRVIKSNATSISDSVLNQSKKEGVRIQTSDGVVISGTTVTNGEKDGIRLIKCPNATVASTSASLNGRDGLRVQTSLNLSMANDEANDNGRFGIWVKTSPPVASVDDLIAAGNAANGNGTGDLRVN